MPKAKCKTCKIELEKDTRIKIKSAYYCEKCAKIYQEELKAKEEAKDKTTCCICSNEIKKSESVKKGTKYYCKECEERLDREAKAYKGLVDYSMEILGLDKVDGRVLKQIKEYKDTFKYTYGGIQYTIWYCKNILNMNFDKKYGIGIVKVKYIEAERYYLNQQKVIKSAEGRKEYKQRDIVVNLDNTYGNIRKPILINYDDI